MNIHTLQHVPFEGLGSMESYLVSQGHNLTFTRLFEKSVFPKLIDIDWLIIMGGSMGVYDHDKYPWLPREIEYIRKAIRDGKTILGICLGAQLIAASLGARIYKNDYNEIGWYPVFPAKEAGTTILSNIVTPGIKVFHWHGDTFELPPNAISIANSPACQHQGFIVNDKIIGLQFHLETTMDSAIELIHHCRDDLDNSQFVQTEAEILSDRRRFSVINSVMQSILKKLGA